jgi:prepilin-type processing-associated H-X9-DG protein
VNFKTSKNRRIGFTLMEILVVIFIITLLLALLMPAMGKVKSMALRMKCANNLRQIHVAVDLYTQTNDDTYPCAEDPVSYIVGGDPNINYWLWMGRGWRFFVAPHLNINNIKKNPSVLFCSMDRAAKENYESTSYAYSMAFYHSPEQIDSISSYKNTYGNPKDELKPSIPQKCTNVARPSEKILIGEWFSNHFTIKGSDAGWWTWEGSRNYLFADGQVRFLRAKEIREANDKLPDANLTKRGIKGQDWPSDTEPNSR